MKIMRLFNPCHQVYEKSYLILELPTLWAWFEEPEEVENVNRYRPGGYHPTHIGDNPCHQVYEKSYLILELPTLWAWFEEPEEVENVNRYRPGGYHPTHIRDKFHNDKYVVVNKLGHGTSSTVWLAQNTLIDGEYDALKILTAEASKTTNEHTIRI